MAPRRSARAGRKLTLLIDSLPSFVRAQFALSHSASTCFCPFGSRFVSCEVEDEQRRSQLANVGDCERNGIPTVQSMWFTKLPLGFHWIREPSLAVASKRLENTRGLRRTQVCPPLLYGDSQCQLGR